MVDSILEISKRSYRFDVYDGQTYKFVHRLLGADRCFYHFEMPQIWVGADGVKFRLEVYRHALGEPIKKIRDEGHWC